MITLYGISKSDTIKKTRKWFSDQDLDYQFHDYKKSGCSPELIKQFLKNFSYQELINTRGTTWRKLTESVKTSLNENSAIKLMSEQPSIIKRPLIKAESNWFLGFDENRLSHLIH